MHPIIRIFDYQNDASLSVSGSTESYGTTVETRATCNTYAVLTVQVSASDVVSIGQQARYECDE